MYVADINVKRCDGSRLCQAREVCPTDAFERDEDDDWYIVVEKCTGCGNCLQTCINRAINMIVK